MRNRIFFNLYCFYSIKNVSPFLFFWREKNQVRPGPNYFFRGFKKKNSFYLFFDVFDFFFRLLVSLPPLPVNLNLGIRLKK